MSACEHGEISVSSVDCTHVNFLVLIVHHNYARDNHQRMQWQPTPVLLPGKSHGRRSLVGCSPWGLEESDTTERLYFHFSLSFIGEGNGNHSSIFAWRIPGTAEPGGLPSMGSHRVGHDWSDLAAAAAHASKLMLKILQGRLQQYMNRELPDVQAGFRKGRRTRDQIANICWIIEKVRIPEKHLLLLYWLCQSLWLCGSQ